MKKSILLFISVLAMTAANFSNEYVLKINANGYDNLDLDNIFSQYCGDVKRISSQIPSPNYNDSLVQKAAHNLNTVAPVSYYMYSSVIKSYGFESSGTKTSGETEYYRDKNFPLDIYNSVIIDGSNDSFGMIKNWSTGEEVFSKEKLQHNFDYEFRNKVNPAPKGIKGNTHAYLTYLCGEFRDRPTLIKEKLEWVQNLIKLPVAKQQEIEPSKDLKNIWSLLTAESYAYYVSFSRKAFNAKEEATWANGQTVEISEKWEVDIPVPAFSVCEVKYIVTEYISKPTPEEKEFPGLDTYMKDYDNYQGRHCSQEDRDYYYDFRGDSNIKPNSPESNGMIWHSTSMMNRCDRDASGKVSVKSVKKNGKWVPLDFPLEACQNYLSEPFKNRWNAARAGLASWMMRDTRFDSQFVSTQSLVTIIPSLNSAFQPQSFRFYDDTVYEGSDLNNFMGEFKANFSKYWGQPDFGFNAVFGLKGNGQVDEIDLAYERIQGAVDRHTDWYASGYDDSNFEKEKARVIDQAYSPFVASSYEMSESDSFTAPGITVNGPRDGRRQWMYVFKVHKSQWYNTDSLKNSEPINFETQWFDETSFGTTHLANTERAWDRLGTPLEGEMESILYLHNIMNDGYAIKGLSPSEFPKVVDDGLGETVN